MSPTRRASSGRSTPKRKKVPESEPEHNSDDGDASSRDYEDDARALDSDAIDEDDFPVKKPKPMRSLPKKKAPSQKEPPKKRRKRAHGSDEDDDLELEDGQQVVGTIVNAPTTGQGTSQLSHTCPLRSTSSSPTWTDIPEYIQFPVGAETA
jgi:hypothetical protein